MTPPTKGSVNRQIIDNLFKHGTQSACQVHATNSRISKYKLVSVVALLQRFIEAGYVNLIDGQYSVTQSIADALTPKQKGEIASPRSINVLYTPEMTPNDVNRRGYATAIPSPRYQVTESGASQIDNGQPLRNVRRLT